MPNAAPSDAQLLLCGFVDSAKMSSCPKTIAECEQCCLATSGQPVSDSAKARMAIGISTC